MSPFLSRLALVVTLPCLFAAASVVRAASSPSQRPNIIFMLADDLGYGDLACFGAKDVQSPHLDSLARGGVRFTNAYANGPECTPSRTANSKTRVPRIT